MSRNIEIRVKKRLVAEIDEPTAFYNAIKGNEDAYARLEKLRKERKKKDKEMDDFEIELSEFQKFVKEETLKLENQLEMIDDYQNIILNEKKKKADYYEKIKTVKSNIQQLQEVADLARTCIQQYKSFQELVSNVIKYHFTDFKNVFDIINHVEEMAIINILGMKLKLSIDDDYRLENKDKNNPTFEDQRINLIIKCNDSRGHIDVLKQADITYITRKEKITNTDDIVVFNKVNPNSMKSELEIMKDRLIAMEGQGVQRQIDDIRNENINVIYTIYYHYKEIYIRVNGKMPTKYPSAENQLKYIFDVYKNVKKRLRISKNLQLGKISIYDYIRQVKQTTF